MYQIILQNEKEKKRIVFQNKRKKKETERGKSNGYMVIVSHSHFSSLKFNSLDEIQFISDQCQFIP